MPTIAPPPRAQTLARLRELRRSLYAAGQVPGETRGSIAIHPTGLAEAAGECLLALVIREQAAATIETGMALGLSTLFLVEGILNAPADAPHHTAIDPYQTRDWRSAGLRALRESGVAQFVTLIEDDSALALPRLVSEGRRFDLGYVDGGHLFENAFLDIYYMHRLVRPGGLIVVDDLWMPAIRAAVSYATLNLGLTREDQPDPAARRFAVLRTPTAPVSRPWDHFVPFA